MTRRLRKGLSFPAFSLQACIGLVVTIAKVFAVLQKAFSPLPKMLHFGFLATVLPLLLQVVDGNSRTITRPWVLLVLPCSCILPRTLVLFLPSNMSLIIQNNSLDCYCKPNF